MDAVTQGVLIVAAIAATPMVAKKVANFVANRIKKHKINKKRAQKRRMIHDPEYRQEVLRKQGLVQELDKINTITFSNAKKDRRVGVTARINKIHIPKKLEDMKIFEGQVIYKGQIYCKCSDGVVRGETIYLYNPQLETLKGTPIKPRVVNGAVNEDTVYKITTPGSSEVLTAQIPKCELVSGLSYDFVRGSKYHQDPSIRRYFDIEIPRDERGNLLTVDLSDPREQKALAEYIDRHGRHLNGADGYFGNIYGDAREAAKKFDNERAEPYDISLVTGETAKKEVVEKEKEKVQKTNYGFDYYDRYNYNRPAWMGEHGTQYADNFDLAEHVLGGDGSRRGHRR